MKIYEEKIFDDERKAKRFSYRHKGTVKYQQSLNLETGEIKMVYRIEYIKR